MAQTIKLKRSGTSGAIPTTSQLELGEVAINTYDGKMYIKKNVGGTESIVEVTVAAADAIVVEYQFTATANQTTFSGSDDNSETLSYSAGAVQIFLNGILLDSGVDYTATNGTSIVLSETVDANDYLQVFAFKKKISNGQTTVNTFTGDDSTTAFTLSLDPGDENNTRVYIDGVYQSKGNYSVSGTTLTFSTAPPADTAIEVEIGNRVVTLDTASNLDLPDNVRLRLGTGQDMQLYHDGSNSYLLGTGGSGSLLTRADLFAVQDSSNINMIQASSSTGQVSLYYNTGSTSAIKLRTTSTGVTVTGTAAADALSVDNITIDGTEIDSSSSLMLDIAGNLTVNVDGTTVTLADDTINFGQFYNNASGQFNIYAPTQDKDIVFLGNDGGSTVTALTLDMSAAGAATFNSTIALGDNKQIFFGTGSDGRIWFDGTDTLNITAANGTATTLNVTANNFTIGGASALISGTANDSVVINEDSADIDFRVESNGNTNMLYVDAGNDRVGIGLGNPSTILHAYNNATSAEFRIQNNDGTGHFQKYQDDLYIDNKDTGDIIVRNGTSQTERMRIDSSGNVGIGTSPDAHYTGYTAVDLGLSSSIFGNTTASDTNVLGLANNAYLNSGATAWVYKETDEATRYMQSNGTHVWSYAASGTAGTSITWSEAMRINSSGNVGIGTSSPAFITGSGLEVQRDGVATLRLEDTGSSGKALELSIDDSTGAIINSGSSGLPMIFKVINSEAMRLDTSGRLLVGRTASASDANADDVQIGNTSGAHGLTILSQNSHNGNIYFADNDNNDAGRLIYNHTNNRMEFYTNRSQSMVITSAGNVGIGTNSAAQHFEVHKASARMRLTDGTDQINFGLWDGTNYRLEGDANRPILITSYHTDGIRLGGSGNSHVVINSGGNVGIGTTSPAEKFHVVGNTFNTGQVRANTGTAAAPNFTIDGGAGMFKPTSNVIGFSTNSTERLRITSAGVVGIGTSGPNADCMLEVKGLAQDQYPIIRGTATAGGTNNFNWMQSLMHPSLATDKRAVFVIGKEESTRNSSHISHYHKGGDGSASNGIAFGLYGADDLMFIQATGNVGIGTTSPGANLDIQRTSSGIAQYVYNTGSNQAYINFANATTGRYSQAFGTPGGLLVGVDSDESSVVWNGSNTALRFATNGTERMRITPGGSVGIGTTNPSRTLQIGSAGAGDIVGIRGASYNQVNIAHTSNQSWGMLLTNSNSASNNGYHYSTSGNDNSCAVVNVNTDALHFGTDNAARMTIDHTGNVGIGTTSPANKLQIGSVGSSGYGANDLAIGDGTRVFSTYLNSTSDAIEFYTNKKYGFLGSGGTGNVGIGTSSPASNLHVKTSVDNSVSQGIVVERSLNSDRGYINYTGGAFQFRSTVGDPIVFGETDAEHMRILPDGNVGIGTTSPNSKLTVAGDIEVTGGSNRLLLPNFWIGTVPNTSNNNNGAVLLVNLTTINANNVGFQFSGSIIANSYTGQAFVNVNIVKHYLNDNVAFDVSENQNLNSTVSRTQLQLCTVTYNSNSYLAIVKNGGGTGTIFLNAYFQGWYPSQVTEVASGTYTVTTTHGNLNY